MTQMPAIQMQGAGWQPSARAGAILTDISFSLDAGRILGVVGPNGAGKSTLLRLLYRFYRPTTGRILLGQRDLWSISAHEAARAIAAVLQEQTTDFALTVREVVALGRTPHRSGIARGGAGEARIVADTLARLDLGQMAERAFGTLSGGERQRVMIARALAQQPQILILDEPTNHLDIRHQLEILSLLRGLGIAVVTSLHDLNLAAGLCDDVLVLHQGRALAFGPPTAALTPDVVSRAFAVTAQREVLTPSNQPHFTFHLLPQQGPAV